MINLTNRKNTYYLLGILGFIPFLFIVALCLLDESNTIKYLEVTIFYLFVIISFIGAVYWGIALKVRKESFKLALFSVFPSILVTFFYLLDANIIFKMIMGIILLNCVFYCEKLYFNSFLPTWYLGFRKTLNLLVSSSVLVIIIIAFNYRDYF